MTHLRISFFILFISLSLSIQSQNLPIIAITKITSSVDSSSWLDYKNSKSQNFETMLETARKN